MAQSRVEGAEVFSIMGKKEREQLKALYKSSDWYRRVNKMTDSQVIAILIRLRLQGKV